MRYIESVEPQFAPFHKSNIGAVLKRDRVIVLWVPAAEDNDTNPED